MSVEDSYWGYAKGVVDKMLPYISDSRSEALLVIAIADRTITWKEGKLTVSGTFKGLASKNVKKHRVVGLNMNERTFYRSVNALVEKNVVCRVDIDGEPRLYLNLPYILFKFLQEMTYAEDCSNSEYYTLITRIQRSFHRFFLNNNMPIHIPHVEGANKMRVVDAMQRPTPPKTEKRREKHRNRGGKPYNVHEAIKKINECFWKWDIVMYPDFHDDEPELNGLRYQEIASVRKFIEMFPHPDAFDNFWETATDNWEKVHQMLRATQRYNFDYTGVDITALAFFRKEIKEYVDNDFLPSYEYDLPLYEMEEGDDLFEYDIQCSEEDISLGQTYYH